MNQATTQIVAINDTWNDVDIGNTTVVVRSINDGSRSDVCCAIRSQNNGYVVPEGCIGQSSVNNLYISISCGIGISVVVRSYGPQGVQTHGHRDNAGGNLTGPMTLDVYTNIAVIKCCWKWVCINIDQAKTVVLYRVNGNVPWNKWCVEIRCRIIDNLNQEGFNVGI